MKNKTSAELNLQIQDNIKLSSIASEIFNDAIVRKHYDDFKWIYMGDPDVKERTEGGFRPWPERKIAGETRVYSLSVLSGINTSGDMLQISHDPWIDHRDPSSWLVVRGSIYNGEVDEYVIHDIVCDKNNQIDLSVIKSSDLHNFPPGLHPQLHCVQRERVRFSLKLNDKFQSTSGQYVGGLYGKREHFYLIDDLEDICKIVHEDRQITLDIGRLTALESGIGQVGVSQVLGLTA